MNESGGARGMRKGDAKRGSARCITYYRETSKAREEPRQRGEAGEIKNGRLFIHNFLFIQITSQPSGRP